MVTLNCDFGKFWSFGRRQSPKKVLKCLEHSVNFPPDSAVVGGVARRKGFLSAVAGLVSELHDTESKAGMRPGKSRTWNWEPLTFHPG